MLDPADVLFSTSEMSAIFSAARHVQGMLQFEAALARAEAHLGLIPRAAAESIGATCRVELFDVPAIYAESVDSASPAIPLIKQLGERVDSETRKFVHWGATSQDAIDTASMLQVAEGLHVLTRDLERVATRLAELAEHHRHTLMAGRTLMQQALPITFGLKAARWLALLVRQLQALRDVQHNDVRLQFGGAAGTLAALRDAGPKVAEQISAQLGLAVPELPWHAERDRVVRIAAALGVLAGGVAKIAGDLVLLAQTEVGEVLMGGDSGRGGSSSMPQKRNPVDAIQARAAARVAISTLPGLLAGMEQEHERAAGAWQAEWAAVPRCFRATAAAVQRLEHALEGLHVDATRMRANLEFAHGLIMAESLSMALAIHIGRPAAQQLVQQLGQSGIPLARAAAQNQQVCAAMTAEEIERATDPAAYLGATDVFINRAIAAWKTAAKLAVP